MFDYWLDYYTRLKLFRDNNQIVLKSRELIKIDTELETVKKILKQTAN